MRQALYNIPHLFTLIFSLLPHSSLLPFLPSRCITNPAPSLLSTRRTIVCPIHPRHTPELSKPQFYRNPRRPLQRLRRLPYHHPHLRIHPPRITSVDNQPGIIPRQYGSESIDARFADRVINSRLRLSETFLLCFPSFYRFLNSLLIHNFSYTRRENCKEGGRGDDLHTPQQCSPIPRE